MLFGEYELSPSLIGLSLLPTAHPEAFQRLSVRSSIPCYRDFNLAMGRSLGFASAAGNYMPCSDSLSLRLRGSCRLTSLTTATRRFIMQKARHHTTKGALTACRRTVSGTFSLPYCGCFSPFPHGTGSLSVSGECLALADGPAGFTQGSTCPALLGMTLAFGTSSRKGLSPAAAPRSKGFRSSSVTRIALPQPRGGLNPRGLGCAPFARHYLGYHVLFSLPPGTKMFQFPGFASRTGFGMTGRQPAGLPHSDIRGSKVACTSPRLFAACHVFLRLPEPRHPPYALFFFRRAMRAIAPPHGTYLQTPASLFAGTCRFISLLVYSICSVSFVSLPNGMKETLFLFPVPSCQCSIRVVHRCRWHFPWVENNGFEPLTPCLQSRCSSQLS